MSWSIKELIYTDSNNNNNNNNNKKMYVGWSFALVVVLFNV